MTPAQIKKTTLYRTLAPCIRKQDRDELAHRLAAVSKVKAAYFDGSACRLIAAFWFSESIEGHEYWWELRVRLLNAGYDCA